MSSVTTLELDIEPITPKFGAYVLDIDESEDLTDDVIAAIRAA